MFYGARLAAMPPKLLSDDKRNIVIRPLAYCKESDISAFAAAKQYPIIPCNLCGSQENLQRQNIKAMLAQWEKDTPGRVQQVFNSLQNVAPSQLADTQLFDFETLQVDRSTPREEYEHAEAQTIEGVGEFAQMPPRLKPDNLISAINLSVELEQD